MQDKCGTCKLESGHLTLIAIVDVPLELRPIDEAGQRRVRPSGLALGLLHRLAEAPAAGGEHGGADAGGLDPIESSQSNTRA